MKPSMSRTAFLRFVGFVLAFALFTGSAWGQARVPVRYSVTDLGVVGPGNSAGQPFVITNDGLVSGVVILSQSSGSVSHAVLWVRDSITDINTPGLGGLNSIAFGVNVWGQAVGQADTSTAGNGEDFCGEAALGLVPSGTTCVPFLWQDGMSPLPLLRDASGHEGANGFANQINDLGEAVGTSETTTVDTTSCAVHQFKPVLWFKPFVWSRPEVQALPTVDDDPDGIALAINNRGVAVGATGTCGPFNVINLNNLVPVHGVLWQNGVAHDLGNLGGPSFMGTQASGINNLDQVVGYSDVLAQGAPSFHGFLWRNGKMADLAPRNGDAFSIATAINDRGVVTGVSIDANFNPTAVIWQNGKITDMNTVVPGSTNLVLQTACSVNALGQLIGIALDAATNEAHAYLATPIVGPAETERDTPDLENGSNDKAKSLRQSRFGQLASLASQPE